jgi:hypothetical protein
MGGTFPTPLPHAGLADRSQMPSRVRSYASRVNKMLGLAKVPRPSFFSSRLLVWLPPIARVWRPTGFPEGGDRSSSDEPLA